MSDRFRLKCGLDNAEFGAFESAAFAFERSRSNLLFLIVRIATKDFTDFSIVDSSNIKRSKGMSPRWNSVESLCTPDQYNKLREEARIRSRKPSTFVYMLLRNATNNFSDFSIVQTGGSNGDTNTGRAGQTGHGEQA